jgi:hypothetical protein
MKKMLGTVLVLVVAVLGVFGKPLMAADQTDDKPSPMIGLSRGQTARLNIVNVGGNNLSCEGNLKILDGDGSVLIERRFVLDGGLAASVDLPFSSLSRTDNRVEIRGIIIHSNNLRQCFTAVLPSLETFDDATLVTGAIIFW